MPHMQWKSKTVSQPVLGIFPSSHLIILWRMQNSAAKKSESMFFYVSTGLDQVPGELSLSLAQ